jgi:hypothetical protein
MRTRWLVHLLALGLMVGACSDEEKVDENAPSDDGEANEPGQVAAAPDPEAPGEKTIRPPMAAEEAPAPSGEVGALPPLEDLQKKIATYFDKNVARRLYIQVDKPLYKPGETIWIKSWDLRQRDLAGGDKSPGIRYQLISPKGAVVLRKQVRQANGIASNDFEIPEGVQGGEYKVRAVTFDGLQTERPIILSTYEPPRVKKKLEFVRKAYGVGDDVSATIEVKRPTGEPLANHALTGVVVVDGREIERVKLKTNADGGGLVRFTLPKQIEREDGLLTVLVEDGGVTESVSKRIPIILKKVQLSFFPEGGSMIEGLPTRVYFEAKNTIGKPADVKGRVVDDQGNVVAKFESYDRGLGRFELIPSAGRTYRAEITKPAGVTAKFGLPVALEEGCALRTYDDVDGQIEALRVAVRCTDARKVVVTAMLRENLLDAAALDVPAGEAAVAHLKPEGDQAALARAMGIARVTVFDEALSPLAERLVFRNRRARLQVGVKPNKPGYTPREQVSLTVRTKDPAGQPVAANLALSIVDDTVISFADDKKGHILSRTYLEQEIPGDIEEPKFYFDLKEEKSAVGLELMMGTRGWRKFEWRKVTHPAPPPQLIGGSGRGFGGGAVPEVAMAMDGIEEAEGAPPPGRMRARAAVKNGAVKKKAKGAAPRPKPAPRRAQAPAAAPAPAAPPPPPAEPMPEPEMKAEIAADDEAPGDFALQAAKPMADVASGEAIAMEEDRDWAANKADKRMAEAEPMERRRARRRPAPSWALVRVFPAPKYDTPHEGPRTDFRETIHWAPNVETDASGEAKVEFYLSDAITSFRVFAEGVGAGAAGRHEEVFKSNLPFSMNVKLPVEVSAGDQLQLPLTLTNETDEPLAVALNTSFGDLLKVEKLPAPKGELAAGSRDSLYYPISVVGTQGKTPVRFSAAAGGLTDEFVREVNVVPVGFPQLAEQSGTVQGKQNLTIDVGDATPGTINASLKLYPSPLSTLVSGLDGMLREPHGCFEQTSSTNYPNVMVLQYLKSHDVADTAILQRAQGLIDKGYRRLVSFETKQKGYEWFGSVPPHEALTAYGLLEFADMRDVYGSVDEEMMKRTRKWLMSRRDGKGGFKLDSKALDSFGRASPEVTAAYITYSMAAAGFADGMKTEVDAQAKAAQSTKDPYLLALAANTLLHVPARVAEGKAATARLVGMQQKAGHWTGADHSITRSTGRNLEIETTSLAVMAALQADASPDAVRRGVDWLQNNRGGFGQWGATQATVLALKAMTEYANKSRKTRSSGTFVVLVNGTKVAEESYAEGHKDPIIFDALGGHIRAGKNEIEVVHTGSDPMPYSLAVDYRAKTPATSPDVVVDLQTKLAKSEVKMGENVRLTATVTNKTDKGQPMTLARVGLPGGLTFQTWQLKELREKGLIAFYETRAREVILYFRHMKPSETKEIPIELQAYVPGTFEGPASSAYLYYGNDKKVWTPGLTATVTP